MDGTTYWAWAVTYAHEKFTKSVIGDSWDQTPKTLLPRNLCFSIVS
jgi:hypothetical protein